MTDLHGQIVGASKIARDITERKRREALLQDAYTTLEQRVAERTAALGSRSPARRAFCPPGTPGDWGVP